MNIALLGYGKMGKMIERLAQAQGHTCPLIIQQANAHELTKENIARCDVAIEFSIPEKAYEHVHFAIGAGVPVVCGTTGWLEKKGDVEQWCRAKNGSFLYASNFSLGVNLYNAFVAHIAEKMKNFPAYQIHIEESHHTAKKDKPSGTAITLAEILIQHTPYDTWHLQGEQQATTSSSLPIVSKREPDVVGTHTAYFTSSVDQIAITHHATTREGFALGAILAAEYIKDKKGIFTMNDVLRI